MVVKEWALMAVVSALTLSGGAAFSEEPSGPGVPNPQTITIDNCAKVETAVQKVERPNGTVWVQSVTCTGDSIAPKVRPNGPSSYIQGWNKSPNTVTTGPLCDRVDGTLGSCGQ